jgi:hypothetical protein
MSYGSGARLPVGEDSGALTRPTLLVGHGPQIYKGLVSLAMRLTTHVPKARSYVFYALDT